MGKYDYSNVYIDKSNRKRLYFYEVITDIMTTYDSSNDEVNELIYWLYFLSHGKDYREPQKIFKAKPCDLKADKQVDENTFIRNVWKPDLTLYSIVSGICTGSEFQEKDVLYDITKKIYFMLDDIIYPDYRQGLDYEDTRYYVEIEYINEEQTKKLEEHGMNFHREDWRA